MNIKFFYFFILALFITGQLNAGDWGNVSYERFARLNSPPNKSPSNDWLGLDLDIRRRSFQSSFVFDADVRYFSEGDRAGGEFNYSLSEAYYEYRPSTSHRLTFGRKLVNWSYHEKFWQLGFMNPQRGFRLLDDKQEGLLGFHYDFRPEMRGLRFSVFFSYFHIPTLNPSLRVKDGEVLSNSEWRKMPPTQTVLNDSLVPIHYELNDPSISNIFLNRSAGVNGEYSWGSGKVQSYLLYKPEGALRVNADAGYAIEAERVEVTANPIVNHHLMAGGSIHQRVYGLLGSVGVDFINPNARLGKDFDAITPSQLRGSEKQFESQFFSVRPDYEHETYGYARISLDRYHYHWSINYIQIFTSNIRDSDDFFSDTVKFKNAVGFDIGFWPFEKVYLRFDWKYDLSRRDNILKFDAMYQLASQMSVGIGGELIAAPDDNSYWAPYRTNDSVFGSFRYHF